MRPLNFCRTCDSDFGSVAAYDLHWSGVSVSDRVQQCRDPESLGMERNKHGRWVAERMSQADIDRLAA